MIKIFQTPKWHFVPPSKVPNVKILYDLGDFENKDQLPKFVPPMQTDWQRDGQMDMWWALLTEKSA